MIDLEKEFERMAKENEMPTYKYLCDDGSENQYENRNTSTAYDFYSKGWKKHAEINKEREQATEYYVDCEHLKEEITELKQKLAQTEIENKTMEHNNVWLNKKNGELEDKLARYENPDYVLVPREPTEKMIWFGESGIAVCQKIKAKDVYKDMLEAVEKEDD